MGQKGAKLTAEAEAFHETVARKLKSLGVVTSRKMFGGVGIFKDGKMFAIVSGTRLFFKVDDSNRADYEKAASKKHVPMPYYEVPASVMANAKKLLSWARAAAKVAGRPARASSKKKPARAAPKKK